METLQKAAAPRKVEAVASSFLAEGELADAILALDRNLKAGALMEPAARELCERAGVDPTDGAAVQELLTALSGRLSEMTVGRSDAFEAALADWPAEERFSLPALAHVLWPSLENLHRAGHATPDDFARAIRAVEQPLAALYRRSSGRSEACWKATWEALSQRLPHVFARYAAWLDRGGESALARLAATPEGVAVLTGALGLLTIRMPVSTPLVSGVLALVGYGGIAPLVERLRGRVRTMVFDALRDEDAVLRRLDQPPGLSLTDVLADVRPALFTGVLAGDTTPEALRRHAAVVLDRFRAAASAPGGPGADYAAAVETVIMDKYAPRLVALVQRAREHVEAGLGRRIMMDPHGAGLVVATATLPVSFAIARVTPMGLWDFPLMAALFYAAARTAVGQLFSPRKLEQELNQAMEAEERLLAGLYSARLPP